MLPKSLPPQINQRIVAPDSLLRKKLSQSPPRPRNGIYAAIGTICSHNLCHHHPIYAATGTICKASNDVAATGRIAVKKCFIDGSHAMYAKEIYGNSAPQKEEERSIRKGPWSSDEDSKLINYIAIHGEGGWEALARNAGLRRTGKSCRLRWLNYLNPNIRRGNITPQEQLHIIELRLRYGNRWTQIAKRLPGRTDNEIKNHWRTIIKKQAKQLKCDVNSIQFLDIMRCLWLPSIMEEQMHPTSEVNSVSQSNSTDFDHTNCQRKKLMTDSEILQTGAMAVEMNCQANVSDVSVLDNVEDVNWNGDPLSVLSFGPEVGYYPFSHGFDGNENRDDWLSSEDSFSMSLNGEDFWVSTSTGFNQFSKCLSRA